MILTADFRFQRLPRGVRPESLLPEESEENDDKRAASETFERYFMPGPQETPVDALVTASVAAMGMQQ
ncbi:MAG TPA: hypothetical protein VGA56_18280 [Opitutaceae bacterium]